MLTIEDARIQSSSFQPRTQRVDTLVLHYTALDLEASLRVLRFGNVSVHYVLAENGIVYKILEHDEVGYHAGVSMWCGKTRVNERSIGIEIVNLDGNRNDYPEIQIAALIELCNQILRKNPMIKPNHIVGHSDIAPKRKIDPGKKFPWKRLADAGIGLWPSGFTLEPAGTETETQALLERFGYPKPHAYGKKGDKTVFISDPDNPPPGVEDIVHVTTADIVRAFHTRFQPDEASRTANPATIGMLKKLVSLTSNRPGFSEDSLV